MSSNDKIRLIGAFFEEICKPISRLAALSAISYCFSWYLSMQPHLKRRLKAGSIHLLLSLGVACCALLLIFRLWYPGALAELQGVSHILLIMIGVDVCLGPLLTTIIMSPGKSLRATRGDLILIGAVQISAFVYGVSTVAQGRPLYLVFNVDRFTVVSELDLDPDSLKRAELQGTLETSWSGPRLVAARLPEDPKTREAILFSSVRGGADLAERAEWYVPYEDERNAVLQHLRPLDELRVEHELGEAEWNRVLQDIKIDPALAGYLPLMAKTAEGVAFLNRQDGSLLAISTLTPAWAKTPPPLQAEPDESKMTP